MPRLKPSLTLLVALCLGLQGCAGVRFTIPKPEREDPAGSAAADSPAADGRDKRPSKPASPAPGKAVIPAGRAPTKEEAAIQAALEKVRAGNAGYKVRPGDLLEISVFQEGDLNRKVRVGADGMITLPLAGKVALDGLDIQAAEAAVGDALKKYLVNPQVSVFVAERSSSLVYILGEVKSPGSYPVPGDRPITVLEAVVLAGGFTQYAAQDRTRVIRNVEGRSEAFQISITAITAGDKSKDMALEPNDVIFVPESFF
ncbi:MAG: polysaccharide biosynthesis/export family protein [Elusimicrobia bacterium]|nr:polysaccharide biosynthesis/export family protein [Elusimicrobiota bacterium]